MHTTIFTNPRKTCGSQLSLFLTWTSRKQIIFLCLLIYLANTHEHRFAKGVLSGMPYRGGFYNLCGQH